MTTRTPLLTMTFAASLAACGPSETGNDGSTSVTDPTTTDGPETGSGDGDGDPSGDGDGDPATGDGDGDGDGDETETGGTKFDVNPPDADTGSGTTGGDPCSVGDDDLSAIGDCEEFAPPDAFEPDVQWSWDGEGNESDVIETPLVINFTDDNDDGVIDLCDTPDVIVAAYSTNQSGHIYVLDGETGSVHFKIEHEINPLATPAAGDIDNDGEPELVTTYLVGGQINAAKLIAFETDGSVMWEGTGTNLGWQHSTALYDIDADGDVEILYGNRVADHLGVELFALATPAGAIQITTAANLDGDADDQLEIVLGWEAYYADGSPYYMNPQYTGQAHPQIADLDDDGLPEILLSDLQGISILEHDGTPTVIKQKPAGGNTYWRPLAIHDVDGDNLPEILGGSNTSYAAIEPTLPDLTPIWTNLDADDGGFAAGTAFDFIGSGAAQAMYADEDFLFIFDGQGNPLLTTPRSSWTESENPVVADVDNDGSAEIVVNSNGGAEPAIQVIRDVEDRWIQARRIWNQHAYHVTNVREDGTIPQVMPNNWELVNTFRTQVQIEGGGICDPPG